MMSGLGNITDTELARGISSVFAASLGDDYHTELVGGASEPFYKPAVGGAPAQLYFREDFPASALHEVAHWCIAGIQRRRQEDFGYHYIAGPRDARQQAAFFELELHTQSLESAFARALGLEFQPSADNLQADIDGFAAAIEAYTRALEAWLASPAGTRARRFIQALEQASRCLTQNQTHSFAQVAARR
jgi:elongation factor P hydroxylase